MAESQVNVQATSLAEAGGEGVERKAGICLRSGAVAATILIQTLSLKKGSIIRTTDPTADEYQLAPSLAVLFPEDSLVNFVD